VADMLGLRQVLSHGRNDGLASMMSVVRGQIRRLLGMSSNEKEEMEVEEGANHVPQQQQPMQNGKKKGPTVAMLLSGGVDSSVALNLLVREGYDVTAFYLKIWLEDELAHLGQCPWEDDYSVCRAVCEQAGVPLETVSLQKQYRDRVISYTVEEARKGRTPNPDIMCNSRVKFGCFYDAIADRGFDYVASGHYAQLVEGGAEEEDGDGETAPQPQRRRRQMHLLRAPDPVKDQTYFLCALTQEQLSRVKFPIGSYLKSEVRDLAQQFQLPNRNRPDSQGLCFLGKVKFDEFINAYLGTDPGDIVDATTGRVIGRHNGLWYHTVGQRKGIGKVLHPKETAKGPWYIVAKDQERNIVIASNEYDQEAFEEARSDFYVEDITWVAGSPPSRLIHQSGDKRWNDGRFTMKIRHGPTLVNGTLTLDDNDADGASGNVHLDTKDKGLAPGQYCVFYNMDDDECLGAGVISERHWAKLLLETSQGEKHSDVAVK
jgi:tRNA (5-methylaminomethyl-2-thiouridylate)-methyltransferase